MLVAALYRRRSARASCEGTAWPMPSETVYPADRGHRSGAARARSRRACASATPTSRSSTELSACAERLGRSPTMREFEADAETTVHPQTVIEHFGIVERTPSAGRPRAAPLRDPRGAARLAARPGRGARPRADRQGHRGAQGRDALEVALLAHVRLAQHRPTRGRLRRAGGRGAPGRAPSTQGVVLADPHRPAAEVRGLGGGPPRPTPTCSPSGRSTACSTRAAGPGRRSSS